MINSRRWWALVAVALATFMTYLDNNVVNVALPSIQRDLHLTISGLEWIVSAYILVFAGLLVAGGRLGDIVGKRSVFFAGLAVFTVSSLVSGLAGSQEMLIGARAAQGVGAALLTPTALALLPVLFPDPRERAAAFGIWGGVGALALAVGPLAGGYLSQHVDWGWIFLVNVPIGVVTAVLAGLSLPPDGERGRRRLDLPGLVSSSAALFAVTFALIEGERRGWTSATILGAFAVAAVAAAAFLAIEARSADPMVDLSVFRVRAFSGGLVAMGGWAFGVFGTYFYTAIYLQDVLGFSPTEAGAGFVPMALVMSVFAILAPRVEARLGVNRTVAVALALMAVSIGVLSTLGAGATYPALLPWFLLFGVGGGLLVPLTNVVIGVLPPARSGIASGILNVSREVAGLMGVALLGAIVNSRENSAAGPALDRFLSGYQLALVVGAVIVAAGVPVSLFALRRAAPVAVEAEAVPEPSLEAI
ncbi:MFS transporter [Rugosimonospora africana]|uniref:MFS transporter n=1 Tax=Rugosimonospora africana TaxID=556532 RepID=A0A8J3QUD7_9ACTN|nr:MFS transporter [Rugosimonospora africana]GIH16983.1 MFS transporter [Rugosimonospora africana]